MRNLLRLVYVVWVLLPEYRAVRRFVRGTAKDGAPTRFAARLAALGPTFVKLGQILSTRPDVMPQPYVDALSRLQENGPEVPREAIRATIDDQLGKPVEELFATFERRLPRRRSHKSIGRRFRTARPSP
jgi:ubiquinone biosynthesis protein